MTTRIETINPTDWVSNNKKDIIIDEEKKTVQVNGEVLQLVFTESPDGPHTVKGEFKMLNVLYDGNSLCSGGLIDDEWFLTDGYDLSRSHTDPYIAAAQMACNLI